jgi:hypothetical protein
VTNPHPRYGQIAYEAYCRHTNGRSLVSGAELPPWDELGPEIQQAWIVAATAVLSGEIRVRAR